MFNIKLKTKSGNDVKKKQIITVFFTLNFKKGLRTTAEYTYRILYGSNQVHDPQRVFAFKETKNILSLEDFTLKVMLNFVHIISKLTEAEDIDPDFVLFISDDFGQKNKSWHFLSDVFKRASIKPKGKDDTPVDQFMATLDSEGVRYDVLWDQARCNSFKIDKDALDMLKSFSDANPNTKFMTIDPNRDPIKYAKSISICKALEERMHMKKETDDGKV